MCVGTNNSSQQCRFKKSSCHNCGLNRHNRRACRCLTINKVYGVEGQKRELSAQRQFRDTEDNLAQEFSKASRDGKQSQRSKHNTDQYHTQRMNTQN